MITHLNSFRTPAGYLPTINRTNAADKKSLYFFGALWLAVAFFELIQDYIGSALNHGSFWLGEALSYKLFWLLFIPTSLIIGHGVRNIKKHLDLNNNLSFVAAGVLVLVISLAHLALFSLFLFGLSQVMHANPWSLTSLLTEKFSNRLYVALSINMVLAAAYFWKYRNETHGALSNYGAAKAITVKNGKKTVLVPTDSIHWISANGPYLLIHTAEKKHIITASLKGMLTELPDNFRRIHRSTIANTTMIASFSSRLNGDYDVTMHDGTTLRLSRNYAAPLKGWLL